MVFFRQVLTIRFISILISSIIILTLMLLKENLGQPCNQPGGAPCEPDPKGVVGQPCGTQGANPCESIEYRIIDDRIARLEKVKDRLPVYLGSVAFALLTFIVTNCLLCLRRARWISRLKIGNKLERYERQFTDEIKNKISNYEKSMTDIEMRIQIMSTEKTDIKIKLDFIKKSILRKINRSYSFWKKQTNKGLRKPLKMMKKELKHLNRMRKV